MSSAAILQNIYGLYICMHLKYECHKNTALPVKIIYLENLILKTMNCAMKMFA